MKQKTRSPKPVPPKRRDPKARIPSDVARRVRDGHPWIYSEALRGWQPTDGAGRTLEVVDPDGNFVGQALVAPGESPLLRVYCRKAGQELDQAYIMGVLDRSARLRQRLLNPGPDACYRLLNGDSEGLPALTIDRYGAYLVCCSYSNLVEGYQDLLVETLARQGSWRAIYLQQRFGPPDPSRPRPGAKLLWGEAVSREVVVTEGCVRFIVDVTAPAGTGLFPDMRQGRATVARMAGGRRVLNCFSYTGGFSVVAALSGAAEVVSVDSSGRAHQRARQNFAANGLDVQNRQYEFVAGDTISSLTRMADRGRSFDLAVLDPPTFSIGKRRPFVAVKDYAEIVTATLRVMSPRGVLCVASNSTKLQPEELERAIGRGAHRAGREVIITERLGQPPDYPVSPGFSEGRYLKFFVVQLLN